jgi:hypothetical protein
MFKIYNEIQLYKRPSHSSVTLPLSLKIPAREEGICVSCAKNP